MWWDGNGKVGSQQNDPAVLLLLTDRPGPAKNPIEFSCFLKE
jgi:hypothetical protein